MKPYLVISFYQFYSVADPQEEVALHRAFFETRDITSRIYISEKGVNGQMSAAREDGEAYMNWLRSRPEYQDVEFKIQDDDQHVFPRKCVKYRKNLVGYDEEIDLTQRGDYLEPQDWKKKLEEEEKKILIDVRNDYEWKVGHFEGAELPACATFREFRAYADNLKNTVDNKTPIMMYCTGGIRCELYSAILKDRGFDKVYQLHGGVINYGQKVGNDHWLGKLFVFDDRMVVPIANDGKETVIGKCHFCGKENDDYYNCANMDCNDLFLCCQDCLPEQKGCCCAECQEAPRVRPIRDQNPHRPFRRWHHYFSQRTASVE